MTATITYLEDSDTVSYEITVKSNYKALTKPIASGYLYSNYSTTSDETFEILDVVNCAFATANASASITGSTFFNNCVNYVIDRAHEEGCYVIMSIAPSSEWVTIANPANELVETFANNIVAKINQYGFDGVDLDWEFPESSQKTWFTELARVVREKVKANNPHHLVTAAVGGGMWQPPRYDLTNSKAYLDYINLMCYDMVQADGSYQNGLYRTTSYHDNVNNVGRTYTTSCSVKESVDFIKSNYSIPNEKIVVGVPFYAVKQTRSYDDVNGTWSAWKKSSSPGYTTVKGLLSNNDYTYRFDNNAKVPYIIKNDGTEFYSFDDPTSIACKCEYIIEQELGGMMYWQNGADTTGDLLNAMKTGLSK
ncbi:MAG: hypothetical protein J6W64_11115 [Bacilli bacterium]|nr:hypothetical protein [Bacilli bacterium]